MIDPLQVTINFGAEPSSCDWMVRATTNADSSSMFIHLCLESAAIGTVMGAGAIDNTKVFMLNGL